MQTILSDKNCERQAHLIFYAFLSLDLNEIAPLKLSVFKDVGLSDDADDETVWRFCQKNKYLLLTGNRRAVDGDISLEITTRRLLQETSLPVLTIGNLDRTLHDRSYCEQCANRLAEIVFDLDEKYLGITRLYLPNSG